MANKKPSADTNVLDLTGIPKRPMVKLPHGKVTKYFELRTPEELTFEEFARQVQIGKELTERAGSAGEEGVLEELQALILEGANLILIDLSASAAKALTPGRYLRVYDFFNSQAKLSEADTTKGG
jgi:hypothetical protein